MGACICKNGGKTSNSADMRGVDAVLAASNSQQGQPNCVSNGPSSVDGAPETSSRVADEYGDASLDQSRHRQELKITIDSNLSSPIIDSLVLQTLAIIRTLVDNEQPPPEAMMQLHKIADMEVGWLAIVYSMINKITSSDPLGPAVITLILDECPLPSKEAIMKLTHNLSVSKQSAIIGHNEPMKQRNICILYGFLAEKLAGATSVALLTDSVLEYLIENLDVKRAPYVILHAIVALEKFALTSENKTKVNSRLHQATENPLIKLERWRYSTESYLREVGFCAEWTLDNLFVPCGREFVYEKTENKNLNAMLNSNDTSEYLKISPSGLEARSDVLSFESVRCTFQIDSGAWYYEIELVTNGVLQIGWATKYSKFLNYDGFGIGDDEFSLAYDGCRQLIWHNAVSSKHTHPCWHPGDVLGCYLDVDEKIAIFSLNGKSLPPMNQIFQNATKGFFAAASFMTFQQCIFNFGSKPFKYPPKMNFSTFNEMGHLNEEERVVLPRHKKIETIRRMSVKEDGCQLCYDNHANVKLKPCNHSGFCSSCAIQLDTCPLCRVTIDRVEHESSHRPGSHDSVSHLRTQLSHDKSSPILQSNIGQDQTVK